MKTYKYVLLGNPFEKIYIQSPLIYPTMDETIKMLEKRRRKRAMRALSIIMFFGFLLLLISPIFAMFIGLMLAGAAAYGLSPWRNAYQGFKSSATLSVISKRSAQHIYDVETKELTSRKSIYWDLIVVIFLGFFIFAMAILLMSWGWGGIFSLF